ncbi:MAG: hypothetical protein KOO60_10910 [Gemmatimonadales bacterium]|nr:hypothetical protein [Gemmatimonadales bacterium]
MQNIALPDIEEIAAQIPGPVFVADQTDEFDVLMFLTIRLGIMERFVKALYAKHGEECPLFKEGE